LEAEEKEEEMNKYKWKKRMTEWRELWRRVLYEEYSRIIDLIIRRRNE
jgi:hypothetical protein